MVDSTGYSFKSQTPFSEATGATPFATIFTDPAKQGGSFYTLQVLTGTLKINFLGANDTYIVLGPGIYTDNVNWQYLKVARVDASSAFSAVLLMQGVA